MSEKGTGGRWLTNFALLIVPFICETAALDDISDGISSRVISLSDSSRRASVPRIKTTGRVTVGGGCESRSR